MGNNTDKELIGRVISRLPPEFVEKGMRLAESYTLFGIPLTSLSRDELLAAAAEGWSAYNIHLEQSINAAEMMRNIREAKRRAG